MDEAAEDKGLALGGCLDVEVECFLVWDHSGGIFP